jgi:hypothetical protein
VVVVSEVEVIKNDVFVCLHLERSVLVNQRICSGTVHLRTILPRIFRTQEESFVVAFWFLRTPGKNLSMYHLFIFEFNAFSYFSQHQLFFNNDKIIFKTFFRDTGRERKRKRGRKLMMLCNAQVA